MSTKINNEQAAQNQANTESSDLSFEFMPLEEVTLQNLAEWKTKGDYGKIELYIRSGDIELIPKSTMSTLIEMNRDSQTIVQNLHLLVKGIQPLLKEHETLVEYLDLESPLKVNVSKISQELMMLMAPFGQKEKGLFHTLKNGFDFAALRQVDFEALRTLLQKNQIDLAPFAKFIEALGFTSNKANG